MDALNDAVLGALAEFEVSARRRILIPSGDGLAICLIGSSDFARALDIALAILNRVGTHNETQTDVARRFHVRIGLNHNVDNIVTDINRKPNVSGAGIATAQRLMTLVAGDQVIVGDSIFEALEQREAYRDHFRRVRYIDKHRQARSGHLFADSARCRHLKVSLPAPRAVPEEGAFRTLVAHYVLLALQHRQELNAWCSSIAPLPGESNLQEWKREAKIGAGIALLWILASESAYPQINTASPVVRMNDRARLALAWRPSEQTTFMEQLEYYEGGGVGVALAALAKPYLLRWSPHFEDDGWDPIWLLAKDTLKLRDELAADYPDVVKQYQS